MMISITKFGKFILLSIYLFSLFLKVESEEDDDKRDEKREKEKQERIEASIRKREEEVQKSLSSSLRERDKEREQHKKDEAIEVFKALLADLVSNTG